MLTPWYRLQEAFAAAAERLGHAYPGRITDLRASAFFFFLQYLSEDQGHAENPLPILVITETTAQAGRMQQFITDVSRLVTDCEPAPSDYLTFPDFEPQNLFEYADASVDLLEARSAALDALLRRTARVVFASYKACWRHLPSPGEHTSRQLSVATAEAAERPEATHRIGRGELARWLVDQGYHQVTTVTGTGEFAVRGGLVDVFPVGAELPARIDLFGDAVDEIHIFDPATQLTVSSTAQVRILPVSAAGVRLRQGEALASLEQRWRDYSETYQELLSRSTFERLQEVVQSDLRQVADGMTTPRAGWYEEASAGDDAGSAAPAACLWHYLPEGATVVFREDSFIESETASYFLFWENRFADWLRNGLSFLGLDSFYYRPASSIGETAAGLAEGLVTLGSPAQPEHLPVPALRPLLTHAFGAPDSPPFPCASAGLESIPAGRWGTSRLAESIRSYPQGAFSADSVTGAPQQVFDRPVTVLSQFSARLREILHDAGLQPEIASAILPGGFVIPGDPPWTVVTDMEIFGEIAEIVPKAPRRYTREAVRRPEELSPGDYVVHIDYGIGRFAQLTDRLQSGMTKSYAEIEYSGRDRLYVPVEQLDRLRRYSYDGTAPQLNSLGREQWRKTKEKVQRETLELARKLLSLYKLRQVRPGHAYAATTVWDEEFADGFPYSLTEDQLSAWRDVERDMQAEKPMDRLLCGDVGFGKTEIAMRAAFKACVDEHQVLVLCPTTVLADQHFTTFSRRFRAFPFVVSALSRFQTKAEQREIVEQARAGRIDVLIATHRALSKDVDFASLGLLVIDEEQRFGVKQKEAVKMRWPAVDVLAMSATPIPRTLHMSLVGVRDISLIETAPPARKAVKTYVGEHDEILVRDALLRELGRGGQVYFLHNRIADIERVRDTVERLTPGEKILVAHGQIHEDRLEEVMHAFSLGAYKIMLATTIIENGLDIPAVNTIIVTGAENLGLAQMHQLRGRVGRSPIQAYAYFFHTPHRLLTEEARNRLHAIYNYAYLGAGYEIALSDLRIRGAGNLLGEAQSGLARQVGFEYYCELLARSIRNVKALDVAEVEEWEDMPVLAERPGTQLDLPLPSFIPVDYIDDPVLRLDILRRLAALQGEEAIDAFEAELTDRFGTPPPETHNLFTVIRMKNLASDLGVERLSYDRARLGFHLDFYEDEAPWFKRAPLLDGRLGLSAPGGLDIALPFESEAAARELTAILERLRELRAQQAQQAG